MKHYTQAKRCSLDTLLSLLQAASLMKYERRYPDLSGKILGMVFMNPSLRTKLSFEAAMARCGGQALSITPGESSWAFEEQLGIRMDSDRPEHLKDAVRVMSRYVDALALRSFAKLQSVTEDVQDTTLRRFEDWSTVPVMSLESAVEHPCQMLADMLTIKEICTEPKAKNFCLRWAPHIKPLPLAVPHSAIFAAAHLGMNITVCAPEGYELHTEFIQYAKETTTLLGGTFAQSHDPSSLPDDTKIVYVKSWGATSLYNQPERQRQDFERHAHWMVDAPLLQEETRLLHCMPIRRNLVATDAALDHKNSAIIEQAENRLWAQLSILEWIFTNDDGVIQND